MSGTSLNPYQQWLGIVGDDAPNHYVLLALRPFENRTHVVQQQFESRYAAVRKYQVGQYEDTAHGLLEELSGAFHCLTDPARKARYDQQLRARLGYAPTEIEEALETIADDLPAVDEAIDAEEAAEDVTEEVANSDIEYSAELVTKRDVLTDLPGETSLQTMERLRVVLANYCNLVASCDADMRADRGRSIRLRIIVGVLEMQQWFRRQADAFGPRMISPVLLLAVAFVALVLLSIVTSPSLGSPSILYGGSVAILATFVAALIYLTLPWDASLAGAVGQLKTQFAAIQQLQLQRTIELPRLQAAVVRAESAFRIAQQRYASEVRELRRQRLSSLPWTSYATPEFRRFVAELFLLNGYEVHFDPADPAGMMVVVRNRHQVAVRAIGWPNGTLGVDVVEETSHAGFVDFEFVAIVTNATFSAQAIQRAAQVGCYLFDLHQIADLAYDRVRCAQLVAGGQRPAR